MNCGLCFIRQSVLVGVTAGKGTDIFTWVPNSVHVCEAHLAMLTKWLFFNSGGKTRCRLVSSIFLIGHIKTTGRVWEINPTGNVSPFHIEYIHHGQMVDCVWGQRWKEHTTSAKNSLLFFFSHTNTQHTANMEHMCYPIKVMLIYTWCHGVKTQVSTSLIDGEVSGKTAVLEMAQLMSGLTGSGINCAHTAVSRGGGCRSAMTKVFSGCAVLVSGCGQG